jgi:hypothetical protein
MRIWSIHPEYLDAKGLVALWRETLLAKNVLEGNTKGYKNHPQLERFKTQPFPTDCINAYLQEVYNEALNRNYNFNKDKIGNTTGATIITVTDRQIKYEFNHLLKKLQERDPVKYLKFEDCKNIKNFPTFKIIPGKIETWEKI